MPVVQNITEITSHMHYASRWARNNLWQLGQPAAVMFMLLLVTVQVVDQEAE
jgi:hypothetical protein